MAQPSANRLAQAALTGNLNVSLKYDDLVALSPVVRKEVLTGELNRRLKSMDSVTGSETDTLVEAMSGLGLKELCDGFHSPSKFAGVVQTARNSLEAFASPYPISSSPLLEQDSGSKLLSPNHLVPAPTPASAPEHPSTPVSVSPSLMSPPRTSSPSGSVTGKGGSERDRLLGVVSKLEPNPAKAAEIADLLLTLSRKERAMCIFNSEHLRTKVADARYVLEADDEPAAAAPTSASTAPAAPTTPIVKRAEQIQASPHTPELGSRGPSTTTSPEAPVTPVQNGTSTWTLSALAGLSAAEIIKIASSPTATGLPLPKADSVVTKATDEFVDSLTSKTIQQQKQMLGEKL